MCLGTTVSGHKCVWAQSCLGTIVSGHNRIWTQSCLGTIVSGHNRVWAQSCLGTVVWAQSCGPNHVWAQTWWNRVAASHHLLPNPPPYLTSMALTGYYFIRDLPADLPRKKCRCRMSFCKILQFLRNRLR